MALSRRTFSARGGCIHTYRTPPAYTPGFVFWRDYGLWTITDNLVQVVALINRLSIKFHASFFKKSLCTFLDFDNRKAKFY